MKIFGKTELKFRVATVFILLVLVSLLHIILISPFNVGFSPDDWNFIFWYKILGDNPILKILQVWKEGGAYTTFFIYYIGTLVDIWGFNYQAIGLSNIFLKVFASLSVFYFIKVVFKSTLFSLLAMFFYSISYSAVGSLEYPVKGADYLSILFMNLFFISYYYLIKESKIRTYLLPLTIVLFIFTITASTIRSYPILLIVPSIELIICLKNKKFAQFRLSLIRLFTLYLPFILLLIYKPILITSFVLTSTVIKSVIQGNLHLLLTPFQGLGFMLVPLEVWGDLISRPLDFSSIDKYLLSIFSGGTFLIWAIVTIIMGSFTKKVKAFFIFVTLLNLFLQVLAYFFAFYSRNLSPDLQINFDPPRMYSTVNGIFAFSLSLGLLKEWLRDKANLILLASWSSVFVALTYTTLTWFLADINLGYKETSYYLVVASEFFSIFLASIFSLILEKKEKYMHNNFLGKSFFYTVFCVSIVIIFLINKSVINNFFIQTSLKGRSHITQDEIQSKFQKIFNKVNLENPALFYFDLSEVEKDGPFLSETFLVVFPHRFHFRGSELIDGCFEIFYEDLSKLRGFIRVKGGEKGILYRSLCVRGDKAWYQDNFYKKDNFFAFKIKERAFIDIRQETIERLGL